jgi:ElaB/YqjD/DUF883 family membrane-anchored ribosome-binding protein
MTLTAEVTEVTDLATATLAEVGELAQDQYEHLLEAIRRNPIQSVGLAAGIGFVAVLLARGFSK